MGMFTTIAELTALERGNFLKLRFYSGARLHAWSPITARSLFLFEGGRYEQRLQRAHANGFGC